MFKYLSFDDLDELESKIISWELANRNKRAVLVRSLPPLFVSGIPGSDIDSDRLSFDLQALNETETFNHDDQIVIPFRLWLNAVHRQVRGYPDKESYVQNLINTIFSVGEPDKQITTTMTTLLDSKFKNEKIIKKSDILNFAFLAKAEKVGRSVFYIRVQQFIDGTAKVQDGTNEPIFSEGSAWLIGKKHVITNFHVIEARKKGQHAASVDDFERQAKASIIFLDYIDNFDQAIKIKCKALKAKHAGLDYAILELEEDIEREPLNIRHGPIDFTVDNYISANIIQHPDGKSKKISVRNNLVVLTEQNAMAYLTDTKGGSSGAPVCDDNWDVIALHKASAEPLNHAIRFQGQDIKDVNMGIRIDRIVEDIQSRYPELFSELRG